MKNNRKCRTGLSLALAIASIGACKGVVVIGSPQFSESDAFHQGAPFEAIVEINRGSGGFASGVLISDRHILTAKHFTRPELNTFFVDFNNSSNVRTGGFIRATKVFEAPDPIANVRDLDGTDLAIITLNQPVAGITPMRLLGDPLVALGMTGTLVGYGSYGVGSDAVRPRDQVRRAGTNVIDFFGAAAVRGGFISNTANLFSSDFDSESSTHNRLAGFGSSSIPSSQEATTASGDSGSPLLVEINGEYLIAGIASGGTDPESRYGDVSYWTGVGAYQTEIEAFGGEFVTIPEPSTTITLLSAGIWMLSRRRLSDPSVQLPSSKD